MADAPMTTLLVDPDPAGHHLQSVSWVASEARHHGPVIFLTCQGATRHDPFAVYLGDQVDAGVVEVREVYGSTKPSTSELVAQIEQVCRDAAAGAPVGLVVHLDGDQALKRWWLQARRLRRLPVRPRVHLMLTRYPAQVPLLDRTGWKLRVSKALLSVLGRATGTLHRVVGYKGRGDTARGLVVRRVSDPGLCSAHSRDRARWRSELDLPTDRALVGIFGLISERRNAPMVLEALERGDIDADLVIAGAFDPDVRSWVDLLPPESRRRVVARDGYLDSAVLDRYVASVDIVPVPLTNNGPSGIMGKAEAAGVAVVTAGSKVRAREVEALGGGIACELTVPALGEAMRSVLAGEVEIRSGRLDQESAVRDYARMLLGEDPDAWPSPRRRRSV